MSKGYQHDYPPPYDPEIIQEPLPDRRDTLSDRQPYYGYQEDAVGTITRQFYCPNCNRFNWSKVTNKSGLFTWLLCTYLCLIGCWLCCCIPFCVKKCQDTVHSCVVCQESFAIITPI